MSDMDDGIFSYAPVCGICDALAQVKQLSREIAQQTGDKSVWHSRLNVSVIVALIGQKRVGNKIHAKQSKTLRTSRDRSPYRKTS